MFKLKEGDFYSVSVPSNQNVWLDGKGTRKGKKVSRFDLWDGALIIYVGRRNAGDGLSVDMFEIEAHWSVAYGKNTVDFFSGTLHPGLMGQANLALLAPDPENKKEI